jgi:hypothetical protein
VKLSDLSVEHWLERAFGREVRLQASAWYFDDDGDWWAAPPAVAFGWLTRVFEEPEPAIAWFSDGQIARDLSYLLSTSASCGNCWFYSTEVSLAHRLRCIEAVETFFARLFAPRSAPLLSHPGEAAAGTLNGVCSMWWDEVPASPCRTIRATTVSTRRQAVRWSGSSPCHRWPARRVLCMASATDKPRSAGHRDHRQLYRPQFGAQAALDELCPLGQVRLRAVTDSLSSVNGAAPRVPRLKA